MLIVVCCLLFIVCVGVVVLCVCLLLLVACCSTWFDACCSSFVVRCLLCVVFVDVVCGLSFVVFHCSVSLLIVVRCCCFGCCRLWLYVVC